MNIEQALSPDDISAQLQQKLLKLTTTELKTLVKALQQLEAGDGPTMLPPELKKFEAFLHTPIVRNILKKALTATTFDRNRSES